jgi:hypothetical protein
MAPAGGASTTYWAAARPASSSKRLLPGYATFVTGVNSGRFRGGLGLEWRLVAEKCSEMGLGSFGILGFGPGKE